MSRPRSARVRVLNGPAHRFRTWLTVIMALVAVLGITMSTPSHILEHLRPNAQDAMAQFDAKSQGVQVSTTSDSGKLRALHGHSCAAHCAAHVVSAPPEASRVGHPLLALASWPKPTGASALSSRIFALERPPRA